ncbi:hypothetical protein EDC56_1201 [Sinobacterium caligoides]|uniref:Uncharacterized protein n=1 Tax=Sinobacterium caligoides TaxID=933926 RepID=A0A3N2E258_9GAMM|nr:hypothetical protein [Sinobacterium caligoides]ROS05655.1 hypothetical protein EDC56_1201 [Sinobacterium caligoides]
MKVKLTKVIRKKADPDTTVTIACFHLRHEHPQLVGPEQDASKEKLTAKTIKKDEPT